MFTHPRTDQRIMMKLSTISIALARFESHPVETPSRGDRSTQIVRRWHSTFLAMPPRALQLAVVGTESLMHDTVGEVEHGLQTHLRSKADDCSCLRASRRQTGALSKLKVLAQRRLEVLSQIQRRRATLWREPGTIPWRTEVVQGPRRVELSM